MVMATGATAVAQRPASRITGGATEPLFQANILGKYPTDYHRCVETGFVQTDDPTWLEEAYQSAITALDIGLLQRNFRNVQRTCQVIHKLNLSPATCIDFAGGYGIFTRLMRDQGHDFYWTDPHCENLFAKSFELIDAPAPHETSDPPFALVTAWEVFEHVVEPSQLLDELFSLSHRVLFSTELLPATKTFASADQWWYFAPELGQHVSFYTVKSLQTLAEKHAANFYSDGRRIHYMTKCHDDRPPLSPHGSLRSRCLRLVNRIRHRGSPKSLQPTDYDKLKQRLVGSQRSNG